jgi:hypothetical protein
MFCVTVASQVSHGTFFIGRHMLLLRPKDILANKTSSENDSCAVDDVKGQKYGSNTMTMAIF